MGKTSKVIVCGAKKCGKTTILEQAIYGQVGPFPTTLEDIYVANVDTDRGTREKIRFIDTQGVDDGTVKEVPRHWHAIADAFVLVFAIDDEHSFQLAEVIRKDIEKNREKKEVVVVAIANKLDLSNRRQVDATQALNWASREKIKLFEVSSLNRESLYEPMIYLSSRLNPPPNKSGFPQINIGRKQPKVTSNES
ncbi:NF-kappa-B inhibitor-interacting Ras-like protein 2 [Tigriopus californicus]|uniref:NF-kappa-B inhibitor-interacting Ras-like protein 2 n=1 Tax=Tigriopus californicus TaxID=6832 RepID=UPI0027DA6BD2|nr:NF-kappa-B inhibitor-interacting Ras-like protein 2 [Tigriopus californicus]|eukprot:TCALIF_08283-PA protein Name:"Similar to nkiras2 NF-kappa-B inhibitor-interacting Ras-like protein 2 (Danio rerio)" AED:0.01 eAED:0.01 QI:30/1/1/1/1/1/2/1349/193